MGREVSSNAVGGAVAHDPDLWRTSGPASRDAEVDAELVAEERSGRSLVFRLSVLPFVALIRAYQITLRPFLGGQCRFFPTCSDYGLEAYREHGVWRGTWLTVGRIWRCRPFGGRGYDPVPVRECGCGVKSKAEMANDELRGAKK